MKSVRGGYRVRITNTAQCDEDSLLRLQVHVVQEEVLRERLRRAPAADHAEVVEGLGPHARIGVAGGVEQTLTESPPPDFESGVSANFTTPARSVVSRVTCRFLLSLSTATVVASIAAPTVSRSVGC